MTDEIVIKKDDLLCALWGICLSDHLGDVADRLDYLLEPYANKNS